MFILADSKTRNNCVPPNALKKICQLLPDKLKEELISFATQWSLYPKHICTTYTII